MEVGSTFFQVVKIVGREETPISHGHVDRLSPVSTRINKVISVFPRRIRWIQAKRIIEENGNDLRRRQRRAWMKSAAIQGKAANAKFPRQLR
jgi:hypothetical protein